MEKKNVSWNGELFTQAYEQLYNAGRMDGDNGWYWKLVPSSATEYSKDDVDWLLGVGHYAQ